MNGQITKNWVRWWSYKYNKESNSPVNGLYLITIYVKIYAIKQPSTMLMQSKINLCCVTKHIKRLIFGDMLLCNQITGNLIQLSKLFEISIVIFI